MPGWPIWNPLAGRWGDRAAGPGPPGGAAVGGVRSETGRGVGSAGMCSTSVEC